MKKQFSAGYGKKSLKTEVLRPIKAKKWSGLYKLAGAIFCLCNGLDMKLLQSGIERLIGALPNGLFGSFRPLGRQKLSRVFFKQLKMPQKGYSKYCTPSLFYQ